MKFKKGDRVKTRSSNQTYHNMVGTVTDVSSAGILVESKKLVEDKSARFHPCQLKRMRKKSNPRITIEHWPALLLAMLITIIVGAGIDAHFCEPKREPAAVPSPQVIERVEQVEIKQDCERIMKEKGWHKPAQTKEK